MSEGLGISEGYTLTLDTTASTQFILEVELAGTDPTLTVTTKNGISTIDTSTIDVTGLDVVTYQVIRGKLFLLGIAKSYVAAPTITVPSNVNSVTITGEAEVTAVTLTQDSAVFVPGTITTLTVNGVTVSSSSFYFYVATGKYVTLS